MIVEPLPARGKGREKRAGSWEAMNINLFSEASEHLLLTGPHHQKMREYTHPYHKDTL